MFGNRILFYLVSVILGTEPRVLHMIDKHSITELYSPQFISEASSSIIFKIPKIKIFLENQINVLNVKIFHV